MRSSGMSPAKRIPAHLDRDLATGQVACAGAAREESNAWGWIVGAWRKVHDAHADACTNFAILAAHAKQVIVARVEKCACCARALWPI